MGSKLVARKRKVVEEKYTKPQGLYVKKKRDVDIKKLRKLILESKLAPCNPGDDESCDELEECPICFLYYPSLNRSKCCMKSICTVKSYSDPMEDAEIASSQNPLVVIHSAFRHSGKQETEMQRNSCCGEVKPFTFRQYVSEQDQSYVSSPPLVAPIVELATPSSLSGALAGLLSGH